MMTSNPQDERPRDDKPVDPPASSPEIPPADPPSPDVPKETKSDSFALQCLQYLSFGKYFFVLAKKRDADVPAAEDAAVQLSPIHPTDDMVAASLTKSSADPHVLVVHGTNEALKDEVVAALKKVNLVPVLSKELGVKEPAVEQRLAGIPGLAFAVVILSGDEFVYGKNGKPAEAKLRSLQSVVFELGYLCGRLKRQNVFVLYQEQKSFILPTGLYDVMYTPHDKSGHWQQDLLQRLRLCGLVGYKTIRGEKFVVSPLDKK